MTFQDDICKDVLPWSEATGKYELFKKIVESKLRVMYTAKHEKISGLVFFTPHEYSIALSTMLYCFKCGKHNFSPLLLFTAIYNVRSIFYGQFNTLTAYVCDSCGCINYYSGTIHKHEGELTTRNQLRKDTVILSYTAINGIQRVKVKKSYISKKMLSPYEKVLKINYIEFRGKE